MVSLAVGVLVLLTWLIKPDPIRGHEEHLLMLFVPLFILDGLLPFFMRKKIYFSKRYIFRHEDFTRYIPTKRISRVERKRESLSIIDHQSISPMFKFYKKDYSKKDWIALNEFFDKFHHSKIVEFY